MQARRGVAIGATTMAAALGISAAAFFLLRPETPTLALTFDESGEGGSVSATVGGTASTEVTVSALTTGDGRLSVTTGRSGEGNALDVAAEDGNAVLAVIPATGDTLAPGTEDFSFSVDIRSRGGWEDGANVLQRGLADDAGQYKLQIDGGQPSCTISGTDGRVQVASDRELSEGLWYRLQCDRTDQVVTLMVTRLEDGAEWVTSDTGATGDVRTKLDDTPLSIAAKLTPTGQLANWQPDQFTGAIDNVILRIE